MNHSQSGHIAAIPDEYREVAKAFLPDNIAYGDAQGDAGGDLSPMTGFADALGIGAEYGKLLKIGTDDGRLKEFLGHFQNNLDLLIQKTWVEKADVERKDRLQDDLLPLTVLIQQGNLLQALEKFGIVMEELAYLFFGKQSGEDDFSEYAFRIDPQMGLFWWYCGRINGLKSVCKKGAPGYEKLWAVLLIGLCYLTNF